jgi:cell wall-associated NlpC family hydrolase
MPTDPLDEGSAEDPLGIKQAGEGAARPKNPFEGLTIAPVEDDSLDLRIDPFEPLAAPQAFKVPTFQMPTFINADAYMSATRVGSAANASAKSTEMIAYAKTFLGTPYKWGGTGPLGFDCSGFTQYVFKKMGISIPRVAYQQGTGGKPVMGPDAWQPGDLLFWDNSPRANGADHVALYIGNGMMIAAPKPGDKVKIQSVYGKPWARRYL